MANRLESVDDNHYGSPVAMDGAPPYLTPDLTRLQPPQAGLNTSIQDDRDEGNDVHGDARENTESSQGMSLMDNHERLQANLAEHEELVENLQAQADLKKMIVVERNTDARCEYENALVMLETHAEHLGRRIALRSQSSAPPTWQRQAYGSNRLEDRPYITYSSREDIAQQVAPGRTSNCIDANGRRYENTPLSIGQDIRDDNHFRDVSCPLGGKDISVCAGRGGEMREEDWSKMLLPENSYNDITVEREFVDTARLDTSMESSAYEPQSIQHPLGQYAIHRSDINSVRDMEIVPPPASSALDQARHSSFLEDDPLPYPPTALLGGASDPGPGYLQDSEAEESSIDEERSCLANGKRFMRSQRRNFSRKVGVIVGELRHSSGSSLTNTPSQAGPDFASVSNVDGKFDLKRRRTGASPSDAVPSPHPQGGRPQLPQGGRPQLPQGGRPQLPQGGRPQLPQGGRPQLPQGGRPQLPQGGRPQLPQGRRPQMPQGQSRRISTGIFSGLRGVPNRLSANYGSGMFIPRSRLSSSVTTSRQRLLVQQILGRLPETVRTIIYSHLGIPTRTTTTLRSLPDQSLLPPLQFAFDSHILFTTELFPRNYNAPKRLALLNIFRYKIPYIVPVAVTTLPGQPAIEYYIDPACHSSMSKTSDIPPGPNGQGWPANCVPLEIFERIVGFLPRDTIETLRYVNHEFELKVSNVLFSNVVVPFTPKIYGMLGAEVKAEPMLEDGPHDTKAKGQIREDFKEVTADHDSAAQDAHDGMATFKAWGPRVRTFGMAFDADQGKLRPCIYAYYEFAQSVDILVEQLCRPPKKRKLKEVSTFWGQYEWPHPFYNRYTSIENLEKKADEYRCMSLALSNLRNVQKLGLSVDSGLGWLQGPDISDRAQLFKEQPKIFGKTNLHLDAEAIERAENWSTILHTLGLEPPAYIVDGNTIRDSQGTVTRGRRGFYKAIVYNCSLRNLDGMLVKQNRVRMINNGRRVPTAYLVFQGRNLAAADNAATPVSTFNIRSFGQGTSDSPFKAASLVPSDLTAGQKEWLLETEWAQRAFLSSYCMALMDNSLVFQHVGSLVIARFSSRYLPVLQRDDFWKALPNLKSLTMKVVADYRDIQKNNSGVVEALDIQPSKAAGLFYNLLTVCVATVQGIKTMDLGYYGGGERQTGIFGRNQNILPAPLTNLTDPRNGLATKILVLPHVEHLTLDNCWIAPPILTEFVTNMSAYKMHTLTLNSVSLSAHSSAQPNERHFDEPNPLANGVWEVANGPPRRFGYRKLGHLWKQRGKAKEPSRNRGSWLFTGARVGSWRNVLDTITPGPTVDLLRYAFNYRNDIPKRRDSGALKRINFISCGYVKLVNQPALDQSFIGEVHITPPTTLQKRAMDLMSVMMHRPQDYFLGQIIPALPIEETEVFESCFPMEIGWGKDQSKFDNTEDGQPIGGSGRFSGHVESLVFNTHSYE